MSGEGKRPKKVSSLIWRYVFQLESDFLVLSKINWKRILLKINRKEIENSGLNLFALAEKLENNDKLYST